MIFRIHEKKTELGKFTSDKCEACKKSVTFRLVKTVKYLVVLFVHLIPLGARYESVCEDCEAAETVKNSAARKLAHQYFRGAQAWQRLFMALKLITAAAIIAAAVILPLTLRFGLNNSPEFIKSLVSGDGEYIIKDKDGEVLALIQVADGVKTLARYDEVSTLINTGSKEGHFFLHQYYYETQNEDTGKNVMKRDSSDPGILLDQYDTVVRVYHYNEAEDKLGFYKGVVDLSTIVYTPGRVTYTCVYYMSESQTENYLAVLYIMENRYLRATFASSEDGSLNKLVSISVDTLENGRVVDQTYYYFDEDTISLASDKGLTQDSSPDQYLSFIEENGLSPTGSYQYEYYKDTKVPVSQISSEPDTEGKMQSTTQRFNVTQKGGYYIVEAAE